MNKVILVGRLVREPRIVKKWMYADLAVDNGKDEEGEKKTLFVSLKVHKDSPLFKVMKDYGTKGRQLAVDGRLDIYKAGADEDYKESTSVIIDRLDLLSAPASSEETEDEDEEIDEEDEEEEEAPKAKKPASKPAKKKQ